MNAGSFARRNDVSCGARFLDIGNGNCSLRPQRSRGLGDGVQTPKRLPDRKYGPAATAIRKPDAPLSMPVKVDSGGTVTANRIPRIRTVQNVEGQLRGPEPSARTGRRDRNFRRIKRRRRAKSGRKSALSPKMPQNAAGTRIDPFVSLPSVSGTMPAATAAADPPEEPPATRSGSCGLRVGP